MKILTRGLVVAATFCFCGISNAETSIDEVWQCTLNEGKSMEDVHAANSKWVKYVNANVKGGDISSATVVAIVGDNSRFIFVDTFPDMQSWIGTRAAMETSAGARVEAELEKVASCTSNTLHESTYQ